MGNFRSKQDQSEIDNQMHSKGYFQQKAINCPLKNLRLGPSPVYKPLIKQQIWVLEEAMSKQDCNKLIQVTEKMGYDQALLNTGVGQGFLDKTVRDHMRIMIDDMDSAKIMYQQLRKYVPICQEGAIYSSINERFRFLRYDPKNSFKEHIDGRFPRGTEVSMLTLQIYLNEVKKGGSTRFFDQRLKDGILDVNPCTGSLVIFKQADWSHSGEPVVSGLKYTIRTDIMYRWLDEEQIKDFIEKSQICGLCQKAPRIQRCSRCENHVVICDCDQFSSWTGRRKKPNLLCLKCLKR